MRPLLLVAAASVLLVAEERAPELTRFEPRPVPGGAFAVVAAGSSWRSDHGIVRHRDGGDLIDGGAGVWLGRPDHVVVLAGGTDADAEEGGQLLAEMSARQAWRMAGFAVGAVAGTAAYSQERQWIFDGDLLLGPIHVAAGREDDATAYRLGFGVDWRHRSFALRLAADRVITYGEGDSGRDLATETTALVSFDVLPGVALVVEGGVIHSALGDPDGGDTWYGSGGTVVRF